MNIKAIKTNLRNFKRKCIFYYSQFSGKEVYNGALKGSSWISKLKEINSDKASLSINIHESQQILLDKSGSNFIWYTLQFDFYSAHTVCWKSAIMKNGDCKYCSLYKAALSTESLAFISANLSISNNLFW